MYKSKAKKEQSLKITKSPVSKMLPQYDILPPA